MPTAYTYRIIEGEITDFKGFAKSCMRAFGGTIHMREDDFDSEYIPRKVDTYHSERIKEYETKLKQLNKPNQKIIDEERETLENSLKNYQKHILSETQNIEKLTKILKEAQEWKPPSEEHLGIQKFMMEQLEKTIEELESSIQYYMKSVDSISKSLENLNPNDIRDSRKEDIESSLKYHKKRNKEEIKRVKDSNKWCKDFLNSL